MTTGRKCRVEVQEGGGRLEIRLADQGSGFPPPLLERGAQADSWHSGDHGLGLVIVRRSARRLCGEPRSVNPESGGAVATIDLPDSMVAPGHVSHRASQ